MPETPLFFLIAGEASGDLLGARLMRGLKKLTHGKARFAGIGGPRMREEGIELFFPQEELAHFGLFELLRHVPHLLKRMRQTENEIRRLRPAALITIDAPDFCFRVARKLKGEGIPLIHYVAPTVWAWRPARAKKIAQFLDHLMALLPFEPPYFTREGLDCTFTGHPIVESGAAQGNAEGFRAAYHIKPGQKLLAVLPGSRMSEVSRLMPVFRATVLRLVSKFPDLHVVMPVTANVAGYIKKQSRNWPVPVDIVEGDALKYDVFATAQAALACSGTVSIELAMAKLPAVIAYKLSGATYRLYRRLIKVKYANLVNIMHDRMVVPELLQKDCTPERLSAALEVLFTDDRARLRQLDGLADVAGWLGKDKFVPSERAAETVLAAAVNAKNPQPVTSFAVLQVLPALVTGGVERGAVEVAAALVAAGHRAIVASSGGPMEREVEDAGGVHVKLPLASKNPITIYRNVRKLREVIRHYKADIVHARSRAPAWSAQAAARGTGTAFLTTFHNAYGAKNWLKRRYNAIMSRGARVIAISNFVGEYASGVYGVSRDRLRVIPRGVDISRFDPDRVEPMRVELLRREWKLPKSAPVIMLPARLTRWKGQLVFVEALRLLARTDIAGIIVGGGPRVFRREIEETARRAGIGQILQIVDDCHDMPAALLVADIVVAPSTRPEGFGRVIAEAQAMGRPVIATSHGGACETVIPGETGWLVPPGDAEALARAIGEVLALTEKERAKLAVRSIAHIRENFTTSLMTSRTLAVYSELLQTKK